MQLNHLNLATSDVSALAAFFERHFAFTPVLSRGANAFAILRDDKGFVLTLMKLKATDPAVYPETFHVGFYADTPEAIEAKRRELAEAGLSPGEIKPAGRTGRGAHFYCSAPGNIVIEIATPPHL